MTLPAPPARRVAWVVVCLTSGTHHVAIGIGGDKGEAQRATCAATSRLTSIDCGRVFSFIDDGDGWRRLS